MNDEIFENAVTAVIANSRLAPMLDDLNKVVELERVRWNERRRYNAAGGDGSFLSPLEQAAKVTANKEYAKGCMDLLRDRLAGRITKEDFDQGLKLLECAVEGARTHGVSLGGIRAPIRRNKQGEEHE